MWTFFWQIRCSTSKFLCMAFHYIFLHKIFHRLCSGFDLYNLLEETNSSVMSTDRTLYFLIRFA
ncbi:uncharacterized protein DC041_0008156 [Schistosoma bovis]|uniref:Uncharacterized protein n=1 Tax=Schistosoma bovis TaxID=6184 RepID=A0A430QKB8_SCHBO|nr:uncharacterized protein DC041_0008156 [Schistosoma bovis]